MEDPASPILLRLGAYAETSAEASGGQMLNVIQWILWTGKDFVIWW
jgi:hypothetical protein